MRLLTNAERKQIKWHKLFHLQILVFLCLCCLHLVQLYDTKTNAYHTIALTEILGDSNTNEEEYYDYYELILVLNTLNIHMAGFTLIAVMHLMTRLSKSKSRAGRESVKKWLLISLILSIFRVALLTPMLVLFMQFVNQKSMVDGVLMPVSSMACIMSIFSGYIAALILTVLIFFAARETCSDNGVHQSKEAPDQNPTKSNSGNIEADLVINVDAPPEIVVAIDVKEPINI